MISPTIAADGHTYEHAAIRVWLEHHARSPLALTLTFDLTPRPCIYVGVRRSPLTNEPLVNLDLYPNHLLRSEIYHLLENNEALAKTVRFYERLREEEESDGDRVHVAQPVGGVPPMSQATLVGLDDSGAVAESRAIAAQAGGRACSTDCTVS